MTAEQARQFTRIYGKEKVTNELKRIRQQIEDGAREGRLRVIVGHDISFENKQTLRNLGYSILKDDLGYWVSWDERDRDNG